MDYALLIANFLKERGYPVWSRQRLLHECLRSAIKNGKLGAGTRLLATRQLAIELGMARNTVLYAYEQLATEGFVCSDRRGTVVADVNISPMSAVHVAAQPAPQLSRRAQTLAPLPDAALTSAFAPGVPLLADFPIGPWRRLLNRAWHAVSTDQLNYGDAAGEPRLRAAIADYLRASRGVSCDASQVFITDGTQASLDLCAHAFADAGDVVWMENPGYRGAQTAFRGAELRTHGVAVDQDGMAPGTADWRDHPPKLIYVTPSHQYPLGSVLSLARRMALIEQARTAGALIIEDDYDSEFRHDGPPLSAMQGLSPDAPVLYLGTFSKTMFPALRIGFIVVPPHLVTPLAGHVAQSVSRGRIAEQLALAEFLRSGQFATHLRRMRRLYRQRRDALGTALERHLGTLGTVYGGSAGMHLALGLDRTVSDRLVSAHALQAGIVAHALSAHAVGDAEPAWNGLLLGYAQVPVQQMDETVKRLAAVVHRENAFFAGRFR
jgi:GntR family transcriptional regulator/MocR family aminotransferase